MVDNDDEAGQASSYESSLESATAGLEENALGVNGLNQLL